MQDSLWPLLAAPFVGSLLGVLVRRLPAGRPVAVARSACEACGRRLRPLELVPLISFAALRGRCAGCGTPIAPFHWRIELAAVGAAAWVVSASRLVWADCVLGWFLLALAWIDWDHFRLPDALTLPLILLGLGEAWWWEPWAVTDRAIGAAAGYVLFRVLAIGYRAWRGREGLGQGDAKLLAAAGAWVGWQGLDAVILAGALASIALGLCRARGRPGAGMAIPFGPGLALGLMVVRLYG